MTQTDQVVTATAAMVPVGQATADPETVVPVMAATDLVDRVMAERAVATLARSLVRKALAIRQPVDRMWIKPLVPSMARTPTFRCLTDPVVTVA